MASATPKTPSLQGAAPTPSLQGALPLPSLRGAEGDEATHGECYACFVCGLSAMSPSGLLRSARNDGAFNAIA